MAFTTQSKKNKGVKKVESKGLSDVSKDLLKIVAEEEHAREQLEFELLESLESDCGQYRLMIADLPFLSDLMKNLLNISGDLYQDPKFYRHGAWHPWAITGIVIYDEDDTETYGSLTDEINSYENRAKREGLIIVNCKSPYYREDFRTIMCDRKDIELWTVEELFSEYSQAMNINFIANN